MSLRRAGFTVLSAANSEEAMRIEAAFSETIHLLLSDVIMLYTGGPELAEGLKSRRPQMQVLLMSGSPDDMRILNYHGHFLQKPFLPTDLLGKVRAVLHGEIPARPIGRGQSAAGRNLQSRRPA
jgi:two-component system cell cycle sensor histidine kinase/response regulator CckA